MLSSPCWVVAMVMVLGISWYWGLLFGVGYVFFLLAYLRYRAFFDQESLAFLRRKGGGNIFSTFICAKYEKWLLRDI